MTRRVARTVAILSAATTLWLASAVAPVLGASVLSDGIVTPTEGTTATAFTFSVRYASDDSPTRPAHSVWAQVGDVTVMLTKASGTSHDGTWQATTTLPPGSFAVSFHATTSGDPQPAPISGPSVTVTEPPPPPPAPPSTVPPAPAPPSTTAIAPGAPPTAPQAPVADQQSPSPTQLAAQAPRSSPTSGDANEETASGTSRSDDGDSARAGPTSAGSTAMGNSNDNDVPVESPEPVDPAVSQGGPGVGSQVAALLIVGGAMSLGGAAVLARQWLVSRPRAR